MISNVIFLCRCLILLVLPLSQSHNHLYKLTGLVLPVSGSTALRRQKGSETLASPLRDAHAT